MATPITRQFLREFYEARLSCSAQRIAPYLDDDVSWSISGPVDLLRFCGERRSKEAVLDLLTQVVPSLLRPVRIDLDEVVIDGERAATLVRMSSRHPQSGRIISYRYAQLLHSRDGKLVECRALIDSFDAAEQMVDCSLITAAAPSARAEVIAV
jgi:ketosteroid isomerase-like protein